MVATNLILIDGIAGTGKTTLSRRLHSIIQDRAGAAVLYHEFARPHPIHEWEIEDFPTWRRETIHHWQALAQNLRETQSVAILESTLFQGTVGDRLEWNVDENAILEYARQVPALIQPASPVLVYLVPDDVQSHIERTYASRPERWQRKIDNFMQNTALGRARGLSGLDGYIAFIKTLKRLSDELFRAYAMRKVQIEISRGDWDQVEQRMLEFLEIDLDGSFSSDL